MFDNFFLQNLALMNAMVTNRIIIYKFEKWHKFISLRNARVGGMIAWVAWLACVTWEAY